MDYFTGTGTTTTFNLSFTPASATSILVYISGVKQVSATGNPAYFVNGSQLIFTAAPGAGSPIEVAYLGIYSQVNVPSSQSITTSMLALQVSNTFITQAVADGTSNTITLVAPPISANSLLVTANGVVQYDYTVANSTVQLNFVPPVGTFLRVQAFALAQNGVPNDGSVTTAKLAPNLTLSGDTTFLGSVGFGTASVLSSVGVNINKTITGATTSYAMRSIGQIQSDVTGNARYYATAPSTQAAAFTLGSISHFYAEQGTFSAGSTVTNQYGFVASSALTGATNNYGFYGNIVSATGAWNLYLSGTANNYMAGTLGLGTVSGLDASQAIRIGKQLTGAVNAYSITNLSSSASDVTTGHTGYYAAAGTAAGAFTLSNLYNYSSSQGTIGAGSIVTTQYGYNVASTFLNATNNYGFISQIAAPTSGITTTGTISTISSSTTTVTVNHDAITYTNGQTVTISATANATALTSGATCTILTVGTTDFTLIGAASNTVGVSFTASGAGTGTGTVRLNVQGSGKTVAGAASGSFTYTTTTSQTFAAITVLTGSVTVSSRWSFYAAGTADNYFAGNVGIGTPTPGFKLDVQSPTTDVRFLSSTGTNLVRLQMSNTGGSFQLGIDNSAGSNFGLGAYSRVIWNDGAYPTVFTTASTERMRIDSSGNVGIGTTSPQSKLHISAANVSGYGQLRVNATDTAQMTLSVAETNYGQMYVDTTQMVFGTTAAIPILFRTNLTERMRIDSSGNVGIGTTSPSTYGKFAVVGASANRAFYTNSVAQAVAQFDDNSFVDAGFTIKNTAMTGTGHGIGILFQLGIGGTAVNSGAIQMRAAGDYSTVGNQSSYMGFSTINAGSVSEKMRIDNAGNVGIGTSSPGQRLDVNGSAYFGPGISTGTGLTTGDALIELGGLRTGSGPAYLDLHSTASTDYEARILRNAGVNGAWQIVNTGTGDLQIQQTGAAPITFLTNSTERMRIDSAGNLLVGAAASSTLPTGYVSAANTFGFKNRIINGDGAIYQRASSAALTTTASYLSCDRWFAVQNTTAAGTFGVSATGIGTGYRNQMAIGRNNAATSTGLIYAGQIIESTNVLDLAGSSVTLSFVARAGANFSASGSSISVEIWSGTGTDQGLSSLQAGNWTTQTQFVNQSQAITTTNTRYTFTGTVPSGAKELAIYIRYTPVGTAGADDNLYFTNVQLEKSTVASSFDFRPYSTELALCQRYYYDTGTNSASGYNANGFVAAANFPVTMRTGPTVTMWYSGTQNRIYTLATAAQITMTPTILSGTTGVWAAYDTGISTLSAGVGYLTQFKCNSEL